MRSLRSRRPRSTTAWTANTDLAGGAVLALFAAAALLLAGGGSADVWVFPRAVSGVLLVLGAGLIVKGVIAPDRRDIIERHAALATVLPFVVGLVAYYLALPRLGFVVATIAGFAAATWALRRRFTTRAAIVSLVVATAITLVLYQLFGEVFSVPLPEGSWWEYVGLVD